MAGSYVVSAVAEMGGGRYGLYSGRPRTMSLDDFHDMLDAAYAKAKFKKKQKAHESLQQLSNLLENEALQVWRKKKWEILTPREAEEGRQRIRWQLCSGRVGSNRGPGDTLQEGVWGGKCCARQGAADLNYEEWRDLPDAA